VVIARRRLGLSFQFSQILGTVAAAGGSALLLVLSHLIAVSRIGILVLEGFLFVFFYFNLVAVLGAITSKNLPLLLMVAESVPVVRTIVLGAVGCEQLVARITGKKTSAETSAGCMTTMSFDFSDPQSELSLITEPAMGRKPPFRLLFPEKTNYQSSGPLTVWRS
jgi:hypothetical protein